jgi:hypothetical protein
MCDRPSGAACLNSAGADAVSRGSDDWDNDDFENVFIYSPGGEPPEQLGHPDRAAARTVRAGISDDA